MVNNYIKKNFIKGIKISTILIVSVFINANITLTVISDRISNDNTLFTSHDPIYINGNDDFTLENGVTCGSGSFNDPFIIENWDIDASYLDGITIQNVNSYFIIRNCLIKDGGISNDGIVFINVTNGIIENNYITFNRNGIMFRTQYPSKENSEKNIIRYNNISSNKNDGINFEHTGFGYHSENIVFNNNISSNNRGIYMIMSADNQIIYNNLFSNEEVGIKLDMCSGGGDNNMIHHNNFVNKGALIGQALEYGDPVNKWDNDYPSGGNYWCNYMGTDKNGDGIGDTPYPILIGINEDRYPLMEPVGDINLPPDTPTIDGPKQGIPDMIYDYEFTNCFDPDGDNMTYHVEWGDGCVDEGFVESGGGFTLSHSWDKKGLFTIRAKLIDIYCAESSWATFDVTIPRNKIITNTLLQRFLQNHPYIFQLFQRILTLLTSFK